MVYVLDINGKPLMPTNRHGKVRHLLKDGKAKVVSEEPFTIKLLYDTTKYVQDLILGMDTGSGTLAAAVSTKDGEIVYMSQVEVRSDIKQKMDKRRERRGLRRYRKVRYRKARFDNRKNSKRKDRFSPTMISKQHSHEKEIEFIKSILPISNVVFEVATFDPHLMKNPTMNRHWGYQKGPNYGFENTKAMVRHRDNYTCQYCKKKNLQLEVHHIIFKSHGGSDEAENLITLCNHCHSDLHEGKIKLKNKRGKSKGTLAFATQMNSIRVQLLKNYPEAIETYGYITKTNRLAQNLPKEHYIDAAVIASGGKPITFKTNLIYFKKSVPTGDYKQTDTSRGVITKFNKQKINGLNRYCKVRYRGNIYFISGTSNGEWCVLVDIFGNKADFSYLPRGQKTPKLENCTKISARHSVLIQALSLPKYLQNC